jgi:hypothetical protein
MSYCPMAQPLGARSVLWSWYIILLKLFIRWKEDANRGKTYLPFGSIIKCSESVTRTGMRLKRSPYMRVQVSKRKASPRHCWVGESAEEDQSASDTKEAGANLRQTTVRVPYTRYTSNGYAAACNFVSPFRYFFFRVLLSSRTPISFLWSENR